MSYADTISNAAPVISLAPQAALTTATNGTSADLSGYYAADIYIILGTTVGTAVFLIQDSPDDSAWTDVTDANLIGGGETAITTANDNDTMFRGYRGAQRYVRVRLDSVGTSIFVTALIVRQDRSVGVIAAYGV